ncbi:hypothetical protein FD755_025399 [Muntiacus reevesi]|uniref:FUN14 domain-containing protein 2 n=1 Tax=Muntiacus reevesi TaxID=9886 RepID=A0A5N3UMZ9_MUNRE|nr:hypothetical protein FD755_025399 [Muntiacus reevesi]
MQIKTTRRYHYTPVRMAAIQKSISNKLQALWRTVYMGFIVQKVRKLATTAVGGAFFLLQLANHTGYIKVDWQRVVSFAKKNVLVTGGFFGGFLLGMAS